MTFEASAFIVTWVAIALLTLAVSGLIRQVKALSTAARPQVAHQHAGLGTRVSELPGSKSRQRRLFFFSEPTCRVCRDRLRELLADADDLARNRVKVYVVLPGSVDKLDSTLSQSSVDVLGNQRALFDRMHVVVTPYVAVVSEDDVLSTATPIDSRESLRELIESMKRSKEEESSDAFTARHSPYRARSSRQEGGASGKDRRRSSVWHAPTTLSPGRSYCGRRSGHT